MNYIEIEIGGKKRGFRFGLGFLGDILEYLDVDIGGLGQMLIKNPYRAVPAILYFGHEQVQKKKGIVVDFSLMDVEDWVEGLENTYANKDLEPVLTCFLENAKKYIPGMEEEEEEKGPKKKLTGT